MLTCPPSEELWVRYVIPALYALDAHAHAYAGHPLHADSKTCTIHSHAL
jgi:hypothetical protein